MKFLFSLLKLAVIISVFSRRIEAQHIPTGDERQEVLDAHNRARSEIAAQYNVAAMPALVWSDAAAQHGLNWLNQQSCFSGGLQHSDSYAANFGENLARGQRSWTAAAYDAWFASELSCYEAVHPDWQRCSCTCGHMTAMTWEATTVVGCARCNSTNAYICNYGLQPPNFGGQDVFNAGTGSPCSACPSDMSNCVDNLCTNGTGGGSPPATDPPAPTDPASTDPPVTDSPVTGGSSCGAVVSNSLHQDIDSWLTAFLTDSEDECCSQCENTNGCVSYSFGDFSTSGRACALYDTQHNGVGAAYDNTISVNLEQAPPTPTEPVDPCEGNPCDNGSCQANGDNFVCNCDAGWEGTLCDQDVDDCSNRNNQCVNGDCTDLGTNRFECDCESGWEGDLCDQDIDDCNPDPCQNGRCFDEGTNLYRCECDAGYEGVDCQREITSPEPGATTTERTNPPTAPPTAPGTAPPETTTERTNPPTAPPTAPGTAPPETTTQTRPTATESACDEVIGNPCASGVCVEDLLNFFGWRCECPPGYTTLNTDNSCNLEADRRLVFTFDQPIAVDAVEPFLATFESSLAAYLGVDPSSRFAESGVYNLGPPARVEMVITGVNNANDLPVDFLHQQLVVPQSNSPSAGIMQMPGFATLATIECAGLTCPAVSPDASNPDGAGDGAAVTGAGASEGTSMGLIIGVVAGVVVLLILVGVGGYFGYRRHKNNKAAFYEDQHSMGGGGGGGMGVQGGNPNMYNNGGGHNAGGYGNNNGGGYQNNQPTAFNTTAPHYPQGGHGNPGYSDNRYF